MAFCFIGVACKSLWISQLDCLGKAGGIVFGLTLTLLSLSVEYCLADGGLACDCCTGDACTPGEVMLLSR